MDISKRFFHLTDDKERINCLHELYGVLVPFKRDCDTAYQAIRVYNQEARTGPNRLELSLTLSQVVPFTALGDLREQLGFYHHRTT